MYKGWKLSREKEGLHKVNYKFSEGKQHQQRLTCVNKTTEAAQVARVVVGMGRERDGGAD